MARRKKDPATSKPAPTSDGKTRLNSSLNADERRALHLHHVDKVGAAEAAVAEAKRGLAAAKAVVKNDLGDEGVKEVTLAVKLLTPEALILERQKAERFVRVAQWSGAEVGAQLSLLSTVPTRNWFEEGKTQGLAGGMHKWPDGLSQADGQSWSEGYEIGTMARNAAFAKVLKGSDVDGPLPRVVEPDGDEEDVRGAAQKLREAELATGLPGGGTLGTEPSTATVKH